MNEARKSQHTLAMTIALISWAMLFATLFMGYAIYRSSANVWPPMGFARISLLLPTISTMLILISSWFCYQMKLDINRGVVASAQKNLNITLVLGFGFLVTQTLLWRNMNHTGVYVSSGIFASIMHAFTWIHAVHVLAALVFLVYLYFQFKRHAGNADALWMKTVNAEKFWHFLGIIWILMYFILFVF